MPAVRPSPQHAWNVAARIGLGAWAAGNVYEGLVGVPNLLAAAKPGRTPGVLSMGSPVRFYLPIAPVYLTGMTLTLAENWRAGRHRRAVAVAAACTAAAGTISGYLIRTVNVPLLADTGPMEMSHVRRLIRTWHAANAVRVGLLAGAGAALHRLDRPV